MLVVCEICSAFYDVDVRLTVSPWSRNYLVVGVQEVTVS